MSVALEHLKDYGARESDFVGLVKGVDHRQIRYVDLLGSKEKLALVDAVIESQSQPILYVISASRLTNSNSKADFTKKVAELRRSLAMRGDSAWLGILWPGKLDIYSTDLAPSVSANGKSFKSNEPKSLGIIARLANGENIVKPAELKLRDVLLKLMTHAGMELLSKGLSVDESIALTGRALFFRFLIGRKLISEHDLPSITKEVHSLQYCFNNSIAAAETNEWLDKTFNGDLLKLPTNCYRSYFAKLTEKDESILRPLNAILGLDESLAPGFSQGMLDLGWRALEFDHIPVGLLSETYEELMHHFDPNIRKSTSVYYTPSSIAEYMVAEALYNNSQGSHARILDPACGAGVFLTAAFRRLVELRYEETGVRPQRPELRRILNQQLTGFDINSHARTLASLALYLTALELDPEPTPLSDLAFEKLEGHVLVDVVEPEGNRDSPLLGSIGKHIPSRFSNAFDLVIGNPPWTAQKSRKDPLNKVYTARAREIAKRRGLEEVATTYENPDNVPDLPFLWCAMEWAKKDARICFALAGRMLFKRSGPGLKARKAIFKSLAITGILNGAELRQTNVWPNISQHFCLLFADNRVPQLDEQFVFVSPDKEPGMNKKGRMRIDPSNAQAISISEVISEPTLFKTLFRGSYRDLKVVKHLNAVAENITLGDYWSSSNGLVTGQGYQVASRKFDDGFLEGLPNIKGKYSGNPFYIIPGSLPLYKRQGLLSPRKQEIYKGPIVLLRERASPNRDKGRAIFSESDIAYSESFYGFSAHGHPEADFLAKYLLVIFHSSLFEYYQLMTSPKYGVEREAILVTDVNAFPFVSPSKLSKKQRERVFQGAGSLLSGKPNWSLIDSLVMDIYNLNDVHTEMMKDSLETRSPFASSSKLALQQVTDKRQNQFCEELKTTLENVLKKLNVDVDVELLEESAHMPWKFFRISNTANNYKKNIETIPSEWIKYADDYSVSRITVADELGGAVIVGLLNRYRYWTKTQAKLLSSDLIWQHGSLLERD